MFNLVKKWWKYLTAKLTGSFNERADPKVQLEQAITEARSAHIRLREQAANVIANQKQSELRLNSKLAELEKLNANARQALVMAADADKAGDAAKAQQYNSAAETIANQLIQVEKDVESLKSMVLESAKASDQAKAAVEQNSRLLQEKIAEKSKLMSQLDQAKMQEEMNSAMAQLNEHIGADVPSFEEVREKIEARYTRAKARSELSEASVESRVLEVEQATANVEAQSRLSQLRSELGLDSGQAAAPAAAGASGAASAGRAALDLRVLTDPLIGVFRAPRRARGTRTARNTRMRALSSCRRRRSPSQGVVTSTSRRTTDTSSPTTSQAAAKPSSVYSMTMTLAPNTSV